MALFRKNNADAPDNALSMLFHVAGEAIPENGEDSFCIDMRDDRALVAVFDGCGGIGAQRYQSYCEKTGAYMASRAAAGAAEKWFADNTDAAKLENYIRVALRVCTRYGDQQVSRLRGSLGKSFPTTMAAMVCAPAEADKTENKVQADCFWAGDSRCYLLDQAGLHQLTADDTPGGNDAMSNLTDDGVLTNVINGSEPFTLHRKAYTFSPPCILFSATDGCFGYIATPMEFELLLLRTLMDSKSISEWKEHLFELFSEVSGDDFTMCLAGYGFKNFRDVQRCFSKRFSELDKLLEPENVRNNLWAKYRKEYEAYLKMDGTI